MTKRFCFASMVLFLAACASAPPHVTIKSSEFTHVTEVAGVGQFENPISSYHPHLWQLRTFINRDTHIVSYQVYFYILYKGSRENFKYADDDTGFPLKVVSINKTDCLNDGCIKSEAIGITISDVQLRAHEAAGYRIRVQAKSGDTYILNFTPEMIRLQLQATDRLVHSLDATASPGVLPPAQ